MQEFIGSSGIGVLQAALTICFFLAILFRPQQIKSPIVFRIAFFLLVLSVAFPPIVSFALLLYQGGPNLGTMAGIGPSYANDILPGPLFIGASMLMAFLSLAIGPQQERLQSSEPRKKHALDN